MPEITNKHTVKITLPNGSEYFGMVRTAINYGTEDEPNWYIEFTDIRTSKYAYWKQCPDGGVVEIVIHGKVAKK